MKHQKYKGKYLLDVIDGEIFFTDSYTLYYYYKEMFGTAIFDDLVND